MNHKALLSLLVLAPIILGLVIWIDGQVKSSKLVLVPIPDHTIEDENSIAHAWQWDEFLHPPPSSQESDHGDQRHAPLQNEEEVPFDVVRIYQALERVRLDASGAIIVDDQARNAMESAFANLGDDISIAALSELQTLIKIGLPGLAGEQTAQIVGDFYHLRTAERDFLAVSESEDMRSVSQHFEQLVQLRHAYLGPEIAEKLYAAENVQTRYTFAVMAIINDTTLSEEEKQRRQEQLQTQFDQQMAVIRNSNHELNRDHNEALDAGSAQGITEQEQEQWDQRYKHFLEQKHLVLNAGLTEQDKQQQIDRLLSQHFEAHEQDRAREYDLQYQSGNQGLLTAPP